MKKMQLVECCSAEPEKGKTQNTTKHKFSTVTCSAGAFKPGRMKKCRGKGKPRKSSRGLSLFADGSRW